MNDGTGDVGLDVKFGLTENLTADFTYNTDFAQVEVDEQQVNLTRFSLFFPEKREFFLESRGIFDFGRGAFFGGGGGGGGGTRRAGGFFGGGDAPIIFFSRRIGLEQRDGISRTVPILGGGRLTGKVGPFSIGAIGIRTGSQEAVGAQPTTFSVLRVSRDILRRSRVGAIYTQRSLSQHGPRGNAVYGADGQFAFFENLNFNGYYARSRTPDLGDVGDDASYQGVVTYNGDLYAFQVDHLRVGANFNPEMGFRRRWDFRRTFATAQYSPRPREHRRGPAVHVRRPASTTSRRAPAPWRRASRRSASRPSSRTATGSASTPRTTTSCWRGRSRSRRAPASYPAPTHSRTSSRPTRWDRNAASPGP